MQSIQPRPSGGTSIVRILLIIVGIVILFFVGVAIYNAVRSRQGLPTLDLSTSAVDQTPAPVDGKTRTIIPGSSVPLGEGSDYGIQYWMFIKDWDYQFGSDKPVLKRISSATPSISNPNISLHPTDNSLNVKVNVFAAETLETSDATGDTFTCTVENVPLQSWFSVSVTVFQRNLDIYINGRLVKSCVLPGVPKPAIGDIILGDGKGFSGSICNVHSYPNMLTPDDAKRFFASGTNCAAPTPATADTSGSGLIKLFGYTFRFSTLDKEGKETSSYTL